MSSFADKKIRIFRTKSQEDRVRIQRVRETGRLKAYNSEHDNRSWCPDQNLRRRHILELNRLRHFGLGNYIPIINLIKVLADIAGKEKDEILNEAIESLDKVDQILDENSQLQQTADDLADLADCLNKAGGDLRKENECLRAEIERLKRLLAELQGGMKQTPEDDNLQKIPGMEEERPSLQTKPGEEAELAKLGSLSNLSPEELQKLASEGKLSPELLQKLSSQGKLSPETLAKLSSQGLLPPSSLAGLSKEDLAKLASQGKLSVDDLSKLSPEELAKLAAEGKLPPDLIAKLSSQGLLPPSSLAGLSKEDLAKLASEGKLPPDLLAKLSSQGLLPPSSLAGLSKEDLAKLASQGKLSVADLSKLSPEELAKLAAEGKLPPDLIAKLSSQGLLPPSSLAGLSKEQLQKLASEGKLSPAELAKLGVQPGQRTGSRTGPGGFGPGATGPGGFGPGATGPGGFGPGATGPGGFGPGATGPGGFGPGATGPGGFGPGATGPGELAKLASKDKHPSVEFELPSKGIEESDVDRLPSEAEAEAESPGRSEDKGQKTEGDKDATKQVQRPSKDQRLSANAERLRESEQALSACQDEMKQLLREMDCLRREIERLRRIECQLKEAEKKINNLQCEVETLQCLLHRQDKEANELVKIIETQQAEIDKLQSFEFKLREVCKQRDRLRCTVNSLIASQAEAEESAKQKHAQEICILKKEINRLRAVEVRMKEVEEERDELICKTLELQSILKSKDSELQQLCDQLTKQQECITSLQRLAASYEDSKKPQNVNECCIGKSEQSFPDNENLQAKMTELSDKVCQQATLILSQRKCLLEQHKYILEQEQIRNHMQKKIRDQSRKHAELMDERNILDNEIATLTNRLKSYLDKIQILEKSIEQFLEDQGICGQSDQAGSNNCAQNNCCNSQVDQSSQEQCMNETNFDDPCLHTSSNRSCMCKQSSLSNELPEKLTNQTQQKPKQSRNALNHNIYSGSAQLLNSSSSKLSRNDSFAQKKPCPNKACSTPSAYTPQMVHIQEQDSQPQQKGFMNQSASEAQMYSSVQLDLEEKLVGQGRGYVNPVSQTDYQNQLNASVPGEGSQSSQCQSRVCSSKHSNSTSNKVTSDVSETSSRRCSAKACSQLSGQNSFSAPVSAQQYNCETQSSADNCCPETSFQNFCSEPTSDSCDLISCQSSGGSLKAQYSSPCSDSEVSSTSSTKTHCCPCSDNSNDNNCKKCNITSDLYRYDEGSRTDPCTAPINKLAGYKDDYIPPLAPPTRASQTPTGEMDSLKAGYCAMKDALPCSFKEKVITGTPRPLTNRRPRTDVPKLPHNRPMKRLMHSQTPQFKSIKTKGLLPDTCCCK